MTFIRYISSAGSGKTYALVKEYLKIVLKDKWRFSSVLAITFTNKAATEMKERIIDALKQLSVKEDPVLEETLKKETGLADIDKRSSAVLTRILHNYSDFAVMTIDSFFHKLLRSFSYEEDIPAGFEVELNLKNIDDSIIKKIYSRIGKDKELTEIIIEFVFSKIYSEKSFDIEKDIRNFEKEITNDRRDREIENLKKLNFEMLFPAISGLKKIFSVFIKEFVYLCEEGMRIIEKRGLKPEDFAYKGSGAASFLKKSRDIKPGQLKGFSINSHFEKGEWVSGSTPKDIADNIENAVSEGLDDIREKIIGLYNRDYKRALTAYLIFENIYLLGLTKNIASFIEEYKKENNIIPISEFNRKIFSVIKNDDIPFIYSILGNRFSNILIDEFQDTSRMQWESIYPLIENSLSEGNTCLAVGDPKQSIYRWRGGELEIIEEDIPSRVPRELLNTISLKTNFRAFKNIVDFNNGLFSGLVDIAGDNPLLKRIYGDSAQVSDKGDGGFVSVDFVDGRSNEITDPIVFNRVKEIIAELRGRGFEYSDIVILTRMNSEAEKIAGFLMTEGLPVISPDSLKLAGVPVTGFIVNLLKLIVTPEHRITIAEILFFIKENFKDSVERIDPEDYLLGGDPEDLPSELKIFIKSRELFLRLPLYETVERIIRIFHLDETLIFTPSGYLTAFLDMVLDYTKKEGSDISGFFPWWEINGDEFLIPGSGGGNGINIMTMHKAKGLQFSSVIIPFANWRYRSDGNLWLDGDDSFDDFPISPPCYIKSSGVVENSLFSRAYLEEIKRSQLDNVNLFYVSCTRAIESLHIISKRPGGNEKISNARILYDFVSSYEASKEVIPDTRYISGTLERRVPEREKERQAEEIADMISNPWSDRITIRRRFGDFPGLIPGVQKEKIAFGNLIHRILSGVSENISAESIISGMIRSGEITEEEAEGIERVINPVLSHEMYRNWFFGSGRILNEVTLIDGDEILRPDKVIIENDKVKIVDFKTGVKRESDIDQMNRYRSVFQKMGYESVEGYLYYIDNNGLVTV